eukprot:gene21258-27545_t
MSFVNIINVTVLDNPTSFTNPLQFEITFECIQPLNEDLEWKVIYVGSAENTAFDQVLEEVLVGPVPVGINKFVLQAPAPDYTKINNEDLIGVTVTLVTCSYMEQEFVRIGYYVNNEYTEIYDPEHPPNPVDINKLFRNILADEPRVTRFAINWTGESSNVLPIEETEQQVVVDENDDVIDFDKDEEEDEEETNENDPEEESNNMIGSDDDEDEEGDIDLAAKEEEDENESDEDDEMIEEDSTSDDININNTEEYKEHEIIISEDSMD